MNSSVYAECTRNAAQNVESTSLSRRTTAILLFVFAVLIALMRLHTYDEPTDRDQATYAIIAHEVFAGKSLYDGVLLDQKPPAIHISYGIAELIAGYGRLQVYLLGVGAAIVTMLGFYFAGRPLGRNGGLWAAAIWTVVCGHMGLEANQPNSEVFINAWTVIALAVLLQKPAAQWSWRPAVVAGLCFAAASLYKHVVVVVPAFVLLAYLCVPPVGRTRKMALADMAIIGGIGVLAWAMLFGYFAAVGRLKGMIDCLFLYNRHYSGNAEKNLFSTLLNPETLYSQGLLGLTPLVFCALIGTWLAWRRREYFHAAFLTALAVGTQIAVAAPGKFYPHYYQLWYPFMILGAVVALKPLLEANDAVLGWRRKIPAAFLILLVAIELPDYFKSSVEWSLTKYGPIFAQTDGLAKKIKRLLKPGETFWQLGSQMQLYMDTKQRPAGALADYGMFSGPLADQLSQRNMEGLLAQPPDLLVVETGALPQIPSGHPILTWMKENYVMSPREANQGMLVLMVRKGSDLESRLRSVPTGNSKN